MIRQKWILVFLIGVMTHIEGESQDFRLPNDVIPDHYKIKILTDLSDNFFYNGEVSIDFLVKTATNKIVLHSKNLKIFENETKLEEYGRFMSHTNEKILRKPKEFSWGAVEFKNRPKAEYFDEEFQDEDRENERVLVAEKKKADVDFLRYALYEKNSKDSSESSKTSESSEESSEENYGGNNQGTNTGQPAPGMGTGGAGGSGEIGGAGGSGEVSGEDGSLGGAGGSSSVGVANRPGSSSSIGGLGGSSSVGGSGGSGGSSSVGGSGGSGGSSSMGGSGGSSSMGGAHGVGGSILISGSGGSSSMGGAHGLGGSILIGGSGGSSSMGGSGSSSSVGGSGGSGSSSSMGGSGVSGSSSSVGGSGGSGGATLVGGSGGSGSSSSVGGSGGSGGATLVGGSGGLSSMGASGGSGSSSLVGGSGSSSSVGGSGGSGGATLVGGSGGLSSMGGSGGSGSSSSVGGSGSLSSMGGSGGATLVGGSGGLSSMGGSGGSGSSSSLGGAGSSSSVGGSGGATLVGGSGGLSSMGGSGGSGSSSSLGGAGSSSSVNSANGAGGPGGSNGSDGADSMSNKENVAMVSKKSETDEKDIVDNTMNKIKFLTSEHIKKLQEYTTLHTTTGRTKYSTQEYTSVRTTTNDEQQPVKNQNEKIKYTTTERIKHSTYRYTKNPQESVHTTRQPVKTHTDGYLTTDVTHSQTAEHSTVGYTKHQSTTHRTTMDDKIHFTTYAPAMSTQHSTIAKQESTKPPSVEPVMQPITEDAQTEDEPTAVPSQSGFPSMADIAVNVPQESYSVLKHEFDTGNDFLVVHLDKPLNAGKKYRLRLNYQGLLTDTLTGFHRVPYLKRGSSKSTWLASTVFEPNEARSAFPCFDEPGFKATFDVTLGHNKKFTALSNMPLKTKTEIEGKPEWQWSEFETSPPMSTYTTAFLISDLEYLTPRINYSDSSSNVTYRFWSRPDVLYKTRYAMRIAPEMKNYLESVLGVRDVLPKHDFVALPNFISSALENWGLYSFAEKNLLFTSGFSSIFSKFEITRVVGHEIAHMWFGNMVTPKWWDQIWLSEGFSNFFEVLAADHVQPTWDLKTISVIFSYLKVFTFDALHTSHPLVPKFNHPNDLNEIFDSITYQKGFYLVRMLNYTLGQEAFINGVRRYLRENLLSTADENDLWNALTDSAHHENTLPADYHLKDIMYAWTRRTGYPIIDVVRDYDNHTANITQRRFVRSRNDYEFRDNTLDEEEGDTKWWIPLTYTTGSELNFRDFKPKVWLNPHDDYHVLTDMPSKSDFVLMNLDAAGLYRVNYDQRNWDLIISYLINENSSDISVVNRVQILDDLLDLARAGEISYERALDATSYLTKEKHFLPWKAALSNFDFILRMLRSTESNKSFKKFVRNMVTPRFEELGFESVRNEPLSDGLNRKQIAKWACKTGVRSCTRKSISLFKKWTLEKKPDEHNPIPSNLRSIVYCTAIENGGSKDWQFLWQRYLNNMVTDRTAILYGLGCSRSTRTLRKFLDWSIKETSGIKKQDTPTVFKSVVRNDIGFSLAKTFLRERMGDLKSYIGSNPFYLPQMIESVAAKMNEPADLEELEELEQAHFSHLRSVPRSFRQAAERVRFNINWVEKNFKPIQDWLKKQRI